MELTTQRHIIGQHYKLKRWETRTPTKCRGVCSKSGKSHSLRQHTNMMFILTFVHTRVHDILRCHVRTYGWIHCQEETDGLLCINGHLDILEHMKGSFDKFKLQYLCRKKSYPLQVNSFNPIVLHLVSVLLFHRYLRKSIIPNKGNNKITELRTILQRESQNS